MAGMKKIIKADSEEARQINEHNDRISNRKYGERLFHGMDSAPVNQSEMASPPDAQRCWTGKSA